MGARAVTLGYAMEFGFRIRDRVHGTKSSKFFEDTAAI